MHRQIKRQHITNNPYGDEKSARTMCQTFQKHFLMVCKMFSKEQDGFMFFPYIGLADISFHIVIQPCPPRELRRG